MGPGALPELAELRLRAWAHLLGFRGHVTTKSRAYSTTFTAFTALRRERASWAWRHATEQPELGPQLADGAAEAASDTTLVVLALRRPRATPPPLTPLSPLTSPNNTAATSRRTAPPYNKLS